MEKPHPRIGRSPTDYDPGSEKNVISGSLNLPQESLGTGSRGGRSGSLLGSVFLCGRRWASRSLNPSLGVGLPRSLTTLSPERGMPRPLPARFILWSRIALCHVPCLPNFRPREVLFFLSHLAAVSGGDPLSASRAPVLRSLEGGECAR